MIQLLENPIPIWGIGAVLTGIAGMFFLSRRNLASLLGLVGVVVLTLLLAALEHFVITQAEEVEEATYQLAASVKANDLPAMLDRLAPTATGPRRDAEILSKRLRVVKAHVGGRLRVELDHSSEPLQAISRFHGLIDGVDRQSGIKVVYYDNVELRWILLDGEWRLFDYTVIHQGKPIDAVGRL